MGVAGYLLSSPFPLDGRSLQLWASRAALPLLAAGAIWAAGASLGRGAAVLLRIRPKGFAGGAAAAALGFELGAGTLWWPRLLIALAAR